MPEKTDMAGSTEGLARDRMRDARRLALIEAAEGVFAERGFAGTTMAEIAGRAGYSAANLYNVFEGKEALFHAVVTARGSVLLERLQEALRAPNLMAKIDAFVEALIGFLEEHRPFYAIYLRTTSGFSWNASRLDEQVLEMQSVLERELSRALRRAIQKGEIVREDPELYTCLLFGTLQQYMARWEQLGGTDRDLRKGTEPLRRILRRALGAE
jgi:AcrR family transcriptional regulator